MLETTQNKTIPDPKTGKTETLCYHCGAACGTDKITIEDKAFCCDGCRLVYEIINENGLCDYYNLQSHPGLAQIKAVRNDKYAFLDNTEIARKLYQFSNDELTIVTLYIPSIHCASCMWLLEHLNRVDAGIKESRINFSAKEVTIHFHPKKTTFRKVVELLTTVGYEPYISLDDSEGKKASNYNKQRIVKLGVAGFCFGNIMMLSFPEYLSGHTGIEEQYTRLFRYLNLALSLPVFFYAASEFYATAWAGLKQKILNIDAPIVLALIITFSRSIYEIVTGTGAGYLDSMSGIVFFMLAGRLLQERTYKSLSFTRDYKSYFPIAVNVRTKDGMVTKQLQDLKEKDIVVLHNDEIVPADSISLTADAAIDYSFVTGESAPVRVKERDLVYAGGRLKGTEMVLQIVKPIAGSYLTSLWNHYAFRRNKTEKNDKESTIHLLSKYFTIILFVLTAATTLYWYLNDPSKIITSVSAMLIVACPCALLLAATFTNGNILRILSLNGLYLRDATVIEQMAGADQIVFDKTGTITKNDSTGILYSGTVLTDVDKDLLYAVVSQSNHPNSKALAKWLGNRNKVTLNSWKEYPGMGIEASNGDTVIKVGSKAFAGEGWSEYPTEASLYVNINDKVTSFHLQAAYRKDMPEVLSSLQKNYKLSLLSGDNERQSQEMRALMGADAKLLFHQKPEDKLGYIEHLQEEGHKVMMIGDGLNDAGALQQSNAGVTLTDDVNNFTPACDVIFNADHIKRLPALLEMTQLSAKLIKLSFAVSIIYNIAGLYIAMSGMMRPVTAAILMPCSTLTIVILSSGLSNLIAWRKGLQIKDVRPDSDSKMVAAV